MDNATTTEIADLARSIAAARAFDYAGNFGRGTFRFEVEVTHNDNGVMLRAVTNARISEKQATTELNAVWNELVTALGDAAKPYKAKLATGGKKVGRSGFWHMGHFCTQSFWRGIERRAETVVAQ